jgi:hypothetical protein
VEGACKSEDLSMAGVTTLNFIGAFEAKGEMGHSTFRTFQFLFPFPPFGCVQLAAEAEGDSLPLIHRSFNRPTVPGGFQQCLHV